MTLHVLFGQETARAAELREIAAWLAGWAKHEREWNQNLIALGDFNIDRRGDPLYDAFTSTGLRPAPALNDVPRTIFDDPEEAKFYDQVAWFVEKGSGPVLTLVSTAAGSFDFVPILPGWHVEDHALVEGLGPLPALGRVLGALTAAA